MEHRDNRRIADIEVLRAFAVLLVLVHHLTWNLIPFMKGGRGALYGHLGFWSGVDLFFAISGFVIARSLLPSLAAAKGPRAFGAAALGFWVRRAWRLLPSAWLWLAVMLVLAALFNRSGVFGSIRANLEGAVAAVFYFANVWSLHAWSSGELGVTGVYWTLSTEEQFYFVLPILAFVAGRRLPFAVALIALAQLFIDRTTPHANFLLNLVRSDGLALGVLLAIWSGRPSWAPVEPVWLRGSLWRWLVAPAFLLAFTLASGPQVRAWRLDMALVTLLSVFAVWLASYDRGYVLPEGRVKRALCWVGGRSYALYLIHLPVYHAVVELWSRLDPRMLKAGWAHLVVLLLTAWPLTFALAELNFRFVEDPLRKMGGRIADRITGRPALDAATERAAA